MKEASKQRKIEHKQIIYPIPIIIFYKWLSTIWNKLENKASLSTRLLSSKHEYKWTAALKPSGSNNRFHTI